jgi:hypothetical protein
VIVLFLFFPFRGGGVADFQRTVAYALELAIVFRVPSHTQQNLPVFPIVVIVEHYRMLPEEELLDPIFHGSLTLAPPPVSRTILGGS